MSIRTTLYWIAGMLLLLGILFFTARAFFPDSDVADVEDHGSEETGPPIPQGMQAESDPAPYDSEDTADGFDDSSDLDGWYGESNSEFDMEEPQFDEPRIPEPRGIDDQGRLILRDDL